MDLIPRASAGWRRRHDGARVVPEAQADPLADAAGELGVAVLVTRIVPLSGGLTHKVVEVDNLVVRADLRGQRIGRRLLAAVVEWARQRRAVQVEAVVGDGDGRRFYQSFGFATATANDRLVLTS